MPGGWYSQRVANLPIWDNRNEWWRYDKVDPWHDEADELVREARAGMITGRRVDHRNPEPAIELQINAGVDRYLVLRERAERRKRERMEMTEAQKREEDAVMRAVR